MKDSFAFATGAVRALENTLLPRGFFNSLAEADGEERRRMLADRGFTGFETTADPDLALKGRMQAVYEELLPYLPDPSVLDFCLLPNDYHNLKVALKGLVRGGERADLYRLPAKCDPAALWEPLSAKDWDALPSFLREDAREGYEILTQTGNGQQLDLELDRRSLVACLKAAERAGDLARRYMERFALYADLRCALRLSRQHPGDALIRAALAPVPGLDLAALATAAATGDDAVRDFIRTVFDGLPDDADAAALELMMENDLAALLERARTVSAGPEVPIAYYLARETECKNLRILMTAANAGKGSGAIRERMRETYA